MKRSDTRHIIFNALLFQTCWFLIIFAPWYWGIFPLIVMALHSLLVSDQRLEALKLVLTITVAGITFDSFYHISGIYQFNKPSLSLPIGAFPVWLCMLWFAFALTLNQSLAWIIKKRGLFIIASAILGPVSYLAGRRAGMLDFSDISLKFLSLEWLFIAALITYLADRLPEKKRPLPVINL